MKILYGVVGAGMGHAIRSGVLLEHLVQLGHEVHVAASGNAVSYLRQLLGDRVRRIWGLTLVSNEEEVKMRLTAATNAAAALTGLPSNILDFVDVQKGFAPDLVISDFETWSWFYGKLARIPILCIDNIQAIRRLHHEDHILEGHKKTFRLTKSIVKARTPRADQYLITSFFNAPLRKKRTVIIPPILRQSILDQTPRDDGHLLVYQSLAADSQLEASLRPFGRKILFYGHGLGGTPSTGDSQVVYRAFDPTQFVEDLASAHAVIGSAGFTLMSEAVHLGKPFLAKPIGNQFEQVLNARYLESLGYGRSCTRLDTDTLDTFLRGHNMHLQALEGYQRHDNQLLFEEVASFLDRCAAGLL